MRKAALCPSRVEITFLHIAQEDLSNISEDNVSVAIRATNLHLLSRDIQITLDPPLHHSCCSRNQRECRHCWEDRVPGKRSKRLPEETPLGNLGTEAVLELFKLMHFVILKSDSSNHVFLKICLSDDIGFTWCGYTMILKHL